MPGAGQEGLYRQSIISAEVMTQYMGFILRVQAEGTSTLVSKIGNVVHSTKSGMSVALFSVRPASLPSVGVNVTESQYNKAMPGGVTAVSPQRRTILDLVLDGSRITGISQQALADALQGMGIEWAQESGPSIVGLRTVAAVSANPGEGSIFPTGDLLTAAVGSPRLVIRAGALHAGETYVFSAIGYMLDVPRI